MEAPEQLAVRYPSSFQRQELLAQAVASLPLLAHGRVLGVLSVGFQRPRPFPESERAFLKDLAGQAAQALERARLYAAEQQARTIAQRAAERTTRLQAVTSEFSLALTATRVAEIVVDHGVAAVGARSGGLWLIEPEGTHARLVRTVGYPQVVVERFQRLPLNLGAPLMEALREGRPVWLETPEAATHRYPRQPSRQGATPPPVTPSMACLPLRSEGRTLGALVLNFTEPRRFDAEERAFLELLVHPAAEALARARLLEQQQAAQAALREAHQTLSAIIQASPAAIVLMDTDGTVRMWNAAAERIFGWTEQEALGHLLVSVPPDKHDEFRDNLAPSPRASRSWAWRPSASARMGRASTWRCGPRRCATPADRCSASTSSPTSPSASARRMRSASWRAPGASWPAAWMTRRRWSAWRTWPCPRGRTAAPSTCWRRASCGAWPPRTRAPSPRPRPRSRTAVARILASGQSELRREAIPEALYRPARAAGGARPGAGGAVARHHPAAL